MNEEILMNVINIRAQFSISVVAVEDELLNTFGTLELLFPISKKKFGLVLFQLAKNNCS